MGIEARRSDSRDECRLDLEIPAVPGMLADMRSAIAELSLPGPVLDEARLMVSELVANSMRHAGLHPNDRIRLTAKVADGRLRIDVFDGGRAPKPPLAGAIRPTPGGESGWGLYMVETLASRWGHGPGRYWFELEIDPRRSRLL